MNSSARRHGQSHNRGGKPRWTLAFDEVEPGDEELVGAKAAGLARMTRAGFPVPAGFCVAADAYRAHLDTNGILPKIDSWLQTLASGGVSDSEHRAELAGIRRQIVDAPVDDRLADQIRERLSSLGDDPVAVRSSATAEDLPGHSFAGQHGTYFAVCAEDCLQHVKHCWASLWTEHAFEYRQSRGFDHSSVRMAVVIQSLVEADAAGVIFTADPVSGAGESMIIEACYGLGEALVSGKVSPDRFTISRRDMSVVEHAVGTKEFQVRLGDHGTSRQQSVEEERASLPCIDGDAAVHLAELALELEKEFNRPLDIEWAVRLGKTYFLQARPITTLETTPGTASSPDAATSPHANPEERVVWSNANAGEVLPDVVSPMTWSVVNHLLQVIFGTIFHRAGVDLGDRPIVGLVAGRGYFNVSVLTASMRRITAMRNLDLDEILGGMQGRDHLAEARLVEEDLPDLGYSRAKMLLRLPGFVAWFISHSPLRAGPFVEDVRRKAKAALRFEGEPSEDEIAARMKDAIAGINDMHHSIAFSTVGFAYYANLAIICRKWLDDTDDAPVNRLLTGLGGMASAEAGLALWHLAVLAHNSSAVREAILAGDSFDKTSERIRRVPGGRNFLDAWNQFMDEHGHHTRGEIDVMNARWNEQPDYVLETVRGYVRASGKANPQAVHRARAAERKELETHCRQRLRNPLKRAVFNYVLRRAQIGCVIRENTKSEGVRYVAALRRLLLMTGDRLAGRGVLDRPDDIFFLRLEELDPVRRGEDAADARALVAQRRAEYEYNLTLDPPPVVVGTYDPSAQNQLEAAEPPDAAAVVLTGLAASAGVVTGPARVILRTETDEQVLPGEILVAPFTDPGWTPYFMPAAGIVMDMGGMLSHGSICAREYGIPAVVNVGPATKTIETGQMVQVDGSKGEVRILE